MSHFPTRLWSSGTNKQTVWVSLGCWRCISKLNGYSNLYMKAAWFGHNHIVKMQFRDGQGSGASIIHTGCAALGYSRDTKSIRWENARRSDYLVVHPTRHSVFDRQLERSSVKPYSQYLGWSDFWHQSASCWGGCTYFSCGTHTGKSGS